MKIIVIGLGSMGKRRIRLLLEHKDIEIFGIDNLDSRCSEVKELYGIECLSTLDEACSIHSIEAAFICTSPLSHSKIIEDCLLHNLHVFTEINLVQDGYDSNIALAQSLDKVLFLSSTFLYRKELHTIIEKVSKTKCSLNYIYHVGQYLPDWHPWENYNTYFIGDKRTNGCREIMAIELPWMVSAFGDIIDFKVVKSKNTKLNIKYNDSYQIIFEHKSGAKGVFVVDVVTRKPTRYIEIYGENFQLSWNGTADSLVEYNIDTKQDNNIILTDASEHTDGYASFISENPYREEINSFLKNIENKLYTPVWNFEKDKLILSVIDEIEAI